MFVKYKRKCYNTKLHFFFHLNKASLAAPNPLRMAGAPRTSSAAVPLRCAATTEAPARPTPEQRFSQDHSLFTGWIREIQRPYMAYGMTGSC